MNHQQAYTIIQIYKKLVAIDKEILDTMCLISCDNNQRLILRFREILVFKSFPAIFIHTECVINFILNILNMSHNIVYT